MLELLIVVLILGLLTSYVAPKFFGQVSKSERQAARLQLSSVSKALDAFRLDVGRYPSENEGLRALLILPTNAPKWRGPYLQGEIPLDPWGNAYVYRRPAGSEDHDLFSTGKDGALGGDGDAADVRLGGGQ